MTVYELRHTVYIWDSNECNVFTLLFETKEDAREYLEAKKLDLIDEYCNELNIPYSINDLGQHLLSKREEFYNDFVNDKDYFYAEIEEYGSDTLEITEKEILKFK